MGIFSVACTCTALLLVVLADAVLGLALPSPQESFWLRGKQIWFVGTAHPGTAAVTARGRCLHSCGPFHPAIPRLFAVSAPDPDPSEGFLAGVRIRTGTECPPLLGNTPSFPQLSPSLPSPVRVSVFISNSEQNPAAYPSILLLPVCHQRCFVRATPAGSTAERLAVISRSSVTFCFA